MGLVRRWLCYGDVLNRDAMRGNVVDLAWSGHVNQIIGLNLNLVARRQESVEAHDEVWMALEELGDSADHTWRINALRLKLLHDVQEVIVDLRLIAKLKLNLIQIGKSILDLESLKLLLAQCWGRGWGGMRVSLAHRLDSWPMVMRPSVHS